MADVIPTPQVVINVGVDAKTVEDTVNGAPDTQVTSRLGRKFWTLATINSRLNLVVLQADEAIRRMNEEVDDVADTATDVKSDINAIKTGVNSHAAAAISDINTTKQNVNNHATVAKNDITAIKDSTQDALDSAIQDFEQQGAATIDQFQDAIATIVVNDFVPAQAVAVGDETLDVVLNEKANNTTVTEMVDDIYQSLDDNLIKNGAALPHDPQVAYNDGAIVNDNGTLKIVDGGNLELAVKADGVQVGDSTLDVFADKQKKYTDYNYINVIAEFTKQELSDFERLGEEYDAKVPVQRAIDKAFAENKRLFFPVLLNVFGTLYLPRYNSWFGQDISKTQTKRFSGIRSRAAIMFEAKDENSTYQGFKEVKLDCNRMFLYGDNSICFNKIAITASEMSENLIYNFDVFLNGCLGKVSHIHHNHITNIGRFFITDLQQTNQSTIVDSYIHTNYINAKANGICVLIDLAASAHFGILNNYMDFAYICVQGSNPDTGVISGNIFDISYRGIKLQNGSSLTITANNFPKNQKSHATEYNNLATSVNKELLETTDWMGIDVKSLQYSTIVGNTGTSEALINIAGFTLRYIKSSANINRLNPAKTIILSLTNGGAVADDLQGLSFDELKFRDVTNLPTPSTTIGGVPISSYKGDIIKFNGQVLINDGEKWRGYNGLGVAYKDEKTLYINPIAAGDTYTRVFTLQGLQLGAVSQVSTNFMGVEVSVSVTAVNQYTLYMRNTGSTPTVENNYNFKVLFQNF